MHNKSLTYIKGFHFNISNLQDSEDVKVHRYSYELSPIIINTEQKHNKYQSYISIFGSSEIVTMSISNYPYKILKFSHFKSYASEPSPLK